MLKHFRSAFLVSVCCLGLAAYWGYHTSLGTGKALWLCCILSVLEISLSFDNAIINAGILKSLDRLWQTLFLTLGMLIAVFGMRLLFPILIVAVATNTSLTQVFDLALTNPREYSHILTTHYPLVAVFGGTFLLQVFFSFLFNPDRQLHWLGLFERYIAQLGNAPATPTIASMAVLLALHALLPETFSHLLLPGILGIFLHLIVSSADTLFSSSPSQSTVKRSGLGAFLYLEILDASFSFDGVIGAFAITRDVVVIMLGLAIGAMFVRAITVYLVSSGTLESFVFLEHGAHYAIGSLAMLMLFGIKYHVSEIITGGLGFSLIIMSLISSRRYRQRLFNST